MLTQSPKLAVGGLCGSSVSFISFTGKGRLRTTESYSRQVYIIMRSRYYLFSCMSLTVQDAPIVDMQVVKPGK